MYQRVVVAVDTTRVSESALRVSSALGAHLGECEFITVIPDDAARRSIGFELERIAVDLGWAAETGTVLRSSDTAAAIVHHLKSRPGGLLVIGSSHRPPWRHRSDSDVARTVLLRTDQPTLVAGPHVDPTFRATPTQLIVCVNHAQPSPGTLDAIDQWARSFAADPIWVTEVIPTGTDIDGRGSADVREWATLLEHRQLSASGRLLHGGEPVVWLDEFTSTMPNAVLVATTRHYSDGRRHLHSTTHDLIRRSRHPVLVVPASPTAG